MTLTAIKGGMWIPTIMGGLAASAPAFAGETIDAAAEKVAVTFQVPKTGTLDAFEFRLGTVTQAPGNGLRCSFQDVAAANGFPDGTQDQYRDVTAGLTADTWIAPADLTSDGTDGGTRRNVTRGQFLSAVIEFTNFSVSDSLQISCIDLSGTTSNYIIGNFPGSASYTAAWAVRSDFPVIALRYSDGTVEMVCPTIYPFSALGSSSLAVDIAPHP